MSAGAAERPAKRVRLEADKRRDALEQVQDKYHDIDFTRFQKVVDPGEADPGAAGHFVLVRPAEQALVLACPCSLLAHLCAVSPASECRTEVGENPQIRRLGQRRRAARVIPREHW